MTTIELTVPSMACSACSATITKAIQAVDPAASVTADLATKRLRVETIQPEATVRQAIEAAGYPVS